MKFCLGMRFWLLLICIYFSYSNLLFEFKRKQINHTILQSISWSSHSSKTPFLSKKGAALGHWCLGLICYLLGQSNRNGLPLFCRLSGIHQETSNFVPSKSGESRFSPWTKIPSVALLVTHLLIFAHFLPFQNQDSEFLQK